MPKVSVILPAFNAGRFIKEAVESILCQTYRDFELIVIDDGSTDSTKSILEILAKADGRIRLKCRENRGYTITLNEAAGLCDGSFFARMDADDISLPARFQLQVAYLLANPDCSVVGGHVERIDPEGAPVCTIPFPVRHDLIEATHLGGGGCCLSHPAIMMRADAFRAIGGYRVEMEPAEDFDLWLRMADYGRIANLPETVLRYRLHSENVSHVRRQQQLDNSRIAVAQARQRRGMPPLEYPRPAEPPANLRRHWAKLAHDAGEYSNARRLAMKAFARSPLEPASWRTLAVGALGRHATTLVQAVRRQSSRVGDHLQ